MHSLASLRLNFVIHSGTVLALFLAEGPALCNSDTVSESSVGNVKVVPTGGLDSTSLLSPSMVVLHDGSVVVLLVLVESRVVLVVSSKMSVRMRMSELLAHEQVLLSYESEMRAFERDVA